MSGQNSHAYALKSGRAAVLGHPLGHSLSPQIYQMLSKELRAPFRYERIEILPKDFDETIRVLMRTRLLCGWNLTLPFKKRIVAFLDGLDATADRFGSVNLVKLFGDQWIGYNTDAYGIEQTLAEAGLSQKGLAGQTAVVYGTGGAATTAIRWLVLSGVGRLGVIARDLKAARRLAKEASRLVSNPVDFFFLNFSEEKGRLSERLASCLVDAELWINATPLGMTGFSSPGADLMPLRFPYLSEFGRSGALAFDLVYRPLETPFLKQALGRKMKPIDGLHMLVWQCLRNWQLWHDSHQTSQRRLKKKIYLRLKRKLKVSLKSERIK